MYYLCDIFTLKIIRRDDYVTNEVTCDYNAGWQGLLAGLIQVLIFIKSISKLTEKMSKI